MGRKLIVTGSFFVIGLLLVAFVTLNLLMSLINKPTALSVARIASAVNKGLDILGREGKLMGEMEKTAAPGSTQTLTATLIEKAKQKGIPLKETPAILFISREYKPTFSPSHSPRHASDSLSTWHKHKWNVYSRRPTPEETLVFGLLSLHTGNADDETKRNTAIKILDLQQSDGGWSAFQGQPSDAYATGQALFALQESGMLSPQAPASQKAIEFLLQNQHDDGHWLMDSPTASNGESEKEGGAEEDVRGTEATHWASLALIESLPDKN